MNEFQKKVQRALLEMPLTEAEVEKVMGLLGKESDMEETSTGVATSADNVAEVVTAAEFAERERVAPGPRGKDELGNRKIEIDRGAANIVAHDVRGQRVYDDDVYLAGMELKAWGSDEPLARVGEARVRKEAKSRDDVRAGKAYWAECSCGARFSGAAEETLVNALTSHWEYVVGLGRIERERLDARAAAESFGVTAFESGESVSGGRSIVVGNGSCLKELQHKGEATFKMGRTYTWKRTPERNNQDALAAE